MAKTAGILLIGNEILSGKITDANAAYLCRELRGLGVEVRRITVIPDEVDLIAAEVRAFSSTYDVVFTSGGVGPTHDDVTIEGVARALGVPVVREPRLVRPPRELPQGQGPAQRGPPQDGGGPGGRGTAADGELVFPAVVVRNIYILPGVPEIFRQKFDALRSASATRRSTSVACTWHGGGHARRSPERAAGGHPDLLLGSYPEFSNPEYKVKVTLESKDRGYLDDAVTDFLGHLPQDAVVRVDR